MDYITNHPTGQQSPPKRIKLSQDNFYCTFKKSDTVPFWVSVLFKYDMSRDLEKLIKSSIIIPMGSADAERSFSQMNIIKSKLKSRMKPDLLDAFMHINLNGPKLSWFLPCNYIYGYTVVDGHRKCDVAFQDQRHIKKLDKTLEKLEEERLEAQSLGKSNWYKK